MERINPGSSANPIFRVTREEVLQWLESKLDNMGYPRNISAVQISVEQPFGGARCQGCGYAPAHCSTCGSELENLKHHSEVPELVVMISNLTEAKA